MMQLIDKARVLFFCRHLSPDQKARVRSFHDSLKAESQGFVVTEDRLIHDPQVNAALRKLGVEPMQLYPPKRGSNVVAASPHFGNSPPPPELGLVPCFARKSAILHFGEKGHIPDYDSAKATYDTLPPPKKSSVIILYPGDLRRKILEDG